MLEDVPLLHLAVMFVVAFGAAGVQMWLALWCVKRWDEVQRRGPR